MPRKKKRIRGSDNTGKKYNTTKNNPEKIANLHKILDATEQSLISDGVSNVVCRRQYMYLVADKLGLDRLLVATLTRLKDVITGDGLYSVHSMRDELNARYSADGSRKDRAQTRRKKVEKKDQDLLKNADVINPEPVKQKVTDQDILSYIDQITKRFS